MIRLPRVLFVDDDQTLLRSFERNLRQGPMSWTFAESPAKAFWILSRLHFDAIIVDQNMPMMKGAELLATCREKYPSMYRIMLTGESDTSALQAAVNDGAVHRFFTKPCPVETLQTELENLILREGSKASPVGDGRRVEALVREHLEQMIPGITTIERNVEGAIVVPDDDDDTEVK